MDETQKKIEQLATELDRSIANYQRLFRRNYHWAHGLTMCTLLASGAAALGGFFGLNNKVVGAIALIPGGVTLVVSTLNLQGRAQYHLSRMFTFQALRRRLLFQLPPSPEAVAVVAGEWTTLDTKMTERWKEVFAFNWSILAKQQDGSQPH